VRADRSGLGVVGVKVLRATPATTSRLSSARGDLAASEPEITVFALRDRLDEPLFLEARQVRTGGRCRNLGHGRQFGRGARVAVHQAAQHAGTSRLGDGACEPGQLGVGGCIHTSMVNEV